jgi:hypothetical protein
MIISMVGINNILYKIFNYLLKLSAVDYIFFFKNIFMRIVVNIRYNIIIILGA